MSSPLVLASASPRRRELLALLDVPFVVDPSDADETLPAATDDPEGLAIRLARDKARDVAARHPDALILGADTIVVLHDALLGKPCDADDARAMLARLSGRTHRVVTGVALIDGRSGEIRERAVSTEVLFRALTAAEIDAYVATGEPLDKAGAYGIQERGALLIDGIAGDYPNVVGLPLVAVAELLREVGVRVGQ